MRCDSAKIHLGPLRRQLNRVIVFVVVYSEAVHCAADAPSSLFKIIMQVCTKRNHFNAEQAVRAAARYARPLYAARCSPAPAHTRLTPAAPSGLAP